MIRFGEIRAVGFHPRGVDCVHFGWGNVFSSGLDQTIQSWDPYDGKLWNSLRNVEALQGLAANGNMLSSLHAHCVLPLESRGLLACGLKSGPITLLDYDTGRVVQSLGFEAEPFTKSSGFCSMALSPDGQCLAATNRTYAAIWCLETGNLRWRSQKYGGGNSVQFSRDGQSLIVQPWRGSLRKSNWKSEAPLTDVKIEKLHGQLVTSASADFSGPTQMLASGLRVEKSLTGTSSTSHVDSTADSVLDLEVDMDGTWDGQFGQSLELTSPGLSLAQEPGYILGVNLDQGALTWQAKTHGRIHAFAILPGGKEIFTCGSAGHIDLWDLGAQHPKLTLDLTRSPVLGEAAQNGPMEGNVAIVPYLEEDFYWPCALHTMSLASDSSQLAIGTAAGAVLVVELKKA